MPLKVADLRENLANNLRLPDSPGNADRIVRYERALAQLGDASERALTSPEQLATSETLAG
jgi:hypothetical protein